MLIKNHILARFVANLYRSDMFVASVLATAFMLICLPYIPFWTNPSRLIVWDVNWLMIPAHLLRDRLWESLWYLHYQPPLYSLYGALFINLFSGETYNIALIYANIVLGGGIVAISYLILRVIIPARPLAVILGVIFAVNPSLIINAGFVNYTLFVLFGTMLSVLGIALYQRSNRWRYLLLFMIGVNWVLLSRSSFVVVLIIPAIIYAVWLAKNAWRRVLIWSIIICLPLWGWILRSLMVYNVITVSNAGQALWLIASHDYSPNVLRQLVHQGILSDKIFLPWVPPSIYIEHGFDKTSDIPLLQLDTVHNINSLDIINQVWLKNSLALIRYNPAHYLRNVYQAFKIYAVAPYTSDNAVNWYSDTVVAWQWRDQILPYAPITDFILHGRQIVQPLAEHLGIITVNSWLYIILPMVVIGYPVISLYHNRLSLRRWVDDVRQNPLLVLLAFHTIYTVLIYNFFSNYENDRYRAENEPLHLLFIIAMMWQYVVANQRRWRYMALFGAIGVVWIGLSIILDQPYWGKSVFAQVQPDVREGAIFGDGEIRLVGRDVINTTHQLGDPVEITLYWEALKPIDTIYRVGIHFLDDNLRQIDRLDVVLGSAQPPAFVTTRWLTGRILRETYTLYIPDDAPSRGTLYVNLYRGKDWQYPIPVVDWQGEEIQGRYVPLQSVGILTDEIYPQAELLSSDFILDNRLLVHVGECELIDDVITISGVIMTTDPIPYDAILFFHVLDSQHQMMAQDDNMFIVERWTTSSLIPNRPIAFSRRIALPDDMVRDRYVVKFGAYTLPSAVRLPLVDADDVRLMDDMGVWGLIDD